MMRTVCMASCNLAGKESGLECSCVNNDNFTAVVSGGGRCPWVSMNIPLRKLFGWFRRLQLWAISDWQLHHNNMPVHASCLVQFFGKTSNHPGDSDSLQPRFGTLRLLAFPKTKITFERKEISDCQWDSGKYNGAADGDWENCVTS